MRPGTPHHRLDELLVFQIGAADRDRIQPCTVLRCEANDTPTTEHLGQYISRSTCNGNDVRSSGHECPRHLQHPRPTTLIFIRVHRTSLETANFESPVSSPGTPPSSGLLAAPHCTAVGYHPEGPQVMHLHQARFCWSLDQTPGRYSTDRACR